MACLAVRAMCKKVEEDTHLQKLRAQCSFSAPTRASRGFAGGRLSKHPGNVHWDGRGVWPDLWLWGDACGPAVPTTVPVVHTIIGVRLSATRPQETPGQVRPQYHPCLRHAFLSRFCSLSLLVTYAAAHTHPGNTFSRAVGQGRAAARPVLLRASQPCCSNVPSGRRGRSPWAVS